MFSSVRLREVFFAVGTREMVSASAYGRCPFMGGYKYRVFLRKRPGLQNGVRLQGVSVRRGSTVYSSYFLIIMNYVADENHFGKKNKNSLFA